jgi:Na+/melibiose symporter-like transporter
MGTMGYVNNDIHPETGAPYINVNLISWEHTLQIRGLIAILYLVAGIMLFVGLGMIYNLDKKTLEQMNTELAARKK